MAPYEFQVLYECHRDFDRLVTKYKSLCLVMWFECGPPKVHVLETLPSGSVEVIEPLKG
jgi:hypothetical protein